MSDQDYRAISEMPGVENFLSDAFGRLDRMGVLPRICVAIVAELQLMLRHRLRETPDLLGGRDLDQELAEARRQIGIKYLQLVGEFPQDKEDPKLGTDGGPKSWKERAEAAEAELEYLNDRAGNGRARDRELIADLTAALEAEEEARRLDAEFSAVASAWNRSPRPIPADLHQARALSLLARDAARATADRLRAAALAKVRGADPETAAALEAAAGEMTDTNPNRYEH